MENQIARAQPEGVAAHAILAAFHHLRLKPGWILAVQQDQDWDYPRGLVWAIPPSIQPPEESLWPWPEEPKPPPGATDPMAAITGTGKPLAYLSASLVKRELATLGTRGDLDWYDHELYWGAPLAGPSFVGGLQRP